MAKTSPAVSFNAFTESDWRAFAGATEGSTVAYTQTSTDSVALIASPDGHLEVIYTNADGDQSVWLGRFPNGRCAELFAVGIDFETINLAELDFERLI